MKTPTRAGFYWAKWRIADDGSSTEQGSLPCDTWEVVEVVENSSEPGDKEYLKVSVGGEVKSQSLENFFWGPGPLRPPESPAIARKDELIDWCKCRVPNGWQACMSCRKRIRPT